MLGIGGTQRNHRQQVGRCFFYGNTLPHHFVRQLRLGKPLPILRLNLRNIHIGANFERKLHGHMAIVRTGRFVVQQIINTGKLHLDGSRYRFRHDFRTGTGVIRINLHHGGSNLRKLRNRQLL